MTTQEARRSRMTQAAHNHAVSDQLSTERQMQCLHPNEVPGDCPCGSSCVCRERGCRGYVPGLDRDPSAIARQRSELDAKDAELSRLRERVAELERAGAISRLDTCLQWVNRGDEDTLCRLKSACAPWVDVETVKAEITTATEEISIRRFSNGLTTVRRRIKPSLRLPRR
jgi:hypothetical protein